MNAILEKSVRGIADVVFPPTCVECRSPVEAGGPFRHVCRRCAPRVHFVSRPHCPTCGHPYYGETEALRICQHCVGLDPAFRGGRTAVLFKGPARALVIELKYHHGLFVLEDMAAIFRGSPDLLEFVRGSVLVPVPLHPRKFRERGYNQSALLASALAAEAGGETRVMPLLRRVADTVTQTAFDRRLRQENLKNAFALARVPDLNRDLHYILVDDVFTTGSTLNGCARVLRRAGCLNLDVVTLAHG